MPPIPQALVDELDQWGRESRSGYIKLKLTRGQIVHLFRDYGDPIPADSVMESARDNLTKVVPAP